MIATNSPLIDRKIHVIERAHLIFTRIVDLTHVTYPNQCFHFVPLFLLLTFFKKKTVQGINQYFLALRFLSDLLVLALILLRLIHAVRRNFQNISHIIDGRRF